MQIARERFLDDTSLYHLTLTLGSSTPAAHGLLSTLAEDEARAVGDILAGALDLIERTLGPRLRGASPIRETSSFGCGT